MQDTGARSKALTPYSGGVNCVNLTFMKPRLEIVSPSPDVDTVETLQGLLQAAQEGRVTGFAYVALHAGRNFTGDAVGTAKDSPYETIGLLRALESKITPQL